MARTKSSLPGRSAACKRVSAASAVGDGEGAGVSGAGDGAERGAAVTGVRGWISWARGLGLSVREMVFELHVRQGVPLLSVAGALGMSFEETGALWKGVREDLASRAVKSEGEMGALREHIGAVLWRTVETTFPVLPLGDGIANDGDAAMAAAAEPPAVPSAPMLSVRLKALDLLMKLYGVSPGRDAEDEGDNPQYATPSEIAQSVRERVLEMWGR